MPAPVIPVEATSVPAPVPATVAAPVVATVSAAPHIEHLASIPEGAAAS
jgi:hypothetical protein